MKYRRCKHCHSRVSARKVLPEYPYYCLGHGEDLREHETYEAEPIKAVNPTVEGTADDAGFIGANYCDEYCSHCSNVTFNIPGDRVSLCAHCGEELFPCALCDDGCDWSNDTFGCHRFEHSDEYIRKYRN